jgi:hypothetical protein
VITLSKQSGLGDALFVGGYDLSGDTQSLGAIGGGPAVLDVTPINKSAYERIGGLRDGRIEWTSYFNDASSQAHPVLKTLPTSDVHVMYCRGTTLGNPCASMVAKQINYDGNRGDDGAFTFALQAQANGYGLEWGRLGTAGIRTDTTATNGSSISLTGGDAYIQLPGSSGNTITTPDAAGLDITGDLDIAAKIAADDWTPAADSYIISKYTVTGNQRSYALVLTTTGNLALQFSNDGTAAISKNSTANLSALASGAVKWVRATLDVDNGASGYDVKFYTSDDGVTWTQLGSTVTTATATSVYASTAVLEIGSRNAGTSDFFAGKFFEGWVKNGLEGTAVARPVASTTGVTDATPLTWTVNGTAIPTSRTPYGLQAYLQVFAFTGTSVTVKLQESADNGVNDAWTDVTGGSFTAATGVTTERIATSTTQNVERYLRVVTTGTFTNAQFAVNVVRNPVAVTF